MSSLLFSNKELHLLNHGVVRQQWCCQATVALSFWTMTLSCTPEQSFPSMLSVRHVSIESNGSFSSVYTYSVGSFESSFSRDELLCSVQQMAAVSLVSTVTWQPVRAHPIQPHSPKQWNSEKFYCDQSTREQQYL